MRTQKLFISPDLKNETFLLGKLNICETGTGYIMETLNNMGLASKNRDKTYLYVGVPTKA